MADDGKRQRIPALDGLRAIACLMVLLYHSFQFTGLSQASLPYGLRAVILDGARGVDVFIVLSGFCLFLPIAAHPERFSTRKFALQRIRRIVPAYYASIVYVVALPFVLKGFYRLIGQTTHPEPFPSVVQLASHLLFIHTLSPRTWDGINGSYWSLGLEAQFYLLLPLIALAYRRIGLRVLVLAIAVGLAWDAVLTVMWHDQSFNVAHFLWASNVFARLAEFGAGMLGAFVVAKRPPGPTLARWCAGIGVALGALYLEVENIWPTTGQVATAAWGVAVGLTLVGVSCGTGHVRRALEVPTLTSLGLISYSFYLVHQPTIYYVSQLASKLGINGWTNWAVQLTVGVAGVVAIALIGYQYFERPFLRTVPTTSEVRIVDRLTPGFARRASTRADVLAERSD